MPGVRRRGGAAVWVGGSRRGTSGPSRWTDPAARYALVALRDKNVRDLQADPQLWVKAAVLASGSHPMDIHGIGPAGAARILADVGDVARLPDRNHVASWTGTAPIDATSGEHLRHRLSRAGNRRRRRGRRCGLRSPEARVSQTLSQSPTVGSCPQISGRQIAREVGAISTRLARADSRNHGLNRLVMRRSRFDSLSWLPWMPCRRTVRP
jgi:hypothetical protein